MPFAADALSLSKRALSLDEIRGSELVIIWK